MVKSINLIENTDSRLEKLRHLLTWMNSKGMGRYGEGCFTVDASLTVMPRSEEENLFRNIQEYSRRRGHMFVCYYIKL